MPLEHNSMIVQKPMRTISGAQIYIHERKTNVILKIVSQE